MCPSCPHALQRIWREREREIVVGYYAQVFDVLQLNLPKPFNKWMMFTLTAASDFGFCGFSAFFFAFSSNFFSLRSWSWILEKERGERERESLTSVFPLHLWKLNNMYRRFSFFMSSLVCSSWSANWDLNQTEIQVSKLAESSLGNTTSIEIHIWMLPCACT